MQSVLEKVYVKGTEDSIPKTEHIGSIIGAMILASIQQENKLTTI